MNYQEYLSRKNNLSEEYRKKLQKLDHAYAMANDPIPKDQTTVTDHIGTIQIEKRSTTKSKIVTNDIPVVIYFGVELRKSDNKPKKGNPTRIVWQQNLIKE